MGKTVTAMLIGIALQGRLIRSIDDPAAAYVPGLAGCEYGRTSLRHLLQMSSGVRFTEDYSGADDFSRLRESTIRLNGPGGVSAVTEFNERAASAGTRFSYSSAETQVLGLVLTGATGRPVAELSGAEDLAADGRRGRRDVAHRQRRARGCGRWPERRAARLRAPRAHAGTTDTGATGRSSRRNG
jgi:hypothetical protein